jgi:hypothetical protein
MPEQFGIPEHRMQLKSSIQFYVVERVAESETFGTWGHLLM